MSTLLGMVAYQYTYEMQRKGAIENFDLYLPTSELMIDSFKFTESESIVTNLILLLTQTISKEPTTIMFPFEFLEF
jgi:hypothetical protein